MKSRSVGKWKISTPNTDNNKKQKIAICPRTNAFSHGRNSKITLRKAKRTSTSQVFLGGVEASSCSPTMVQNNRELALELNKAKSRIKELEEKGFSSKAEHFLLMEKYSLLDAQLQRMRDEQQTINIDAGELKKFCRHLRPTLDKALEKLLQSSEFLDEAYKSVSQFLQTIDWRDGDNHRDFSPKYGEPLKTPCDKDESSQMSREAALSLTRLTPSPSSSSSSDNSEMASSHHDDVSTCCTSTPLEGSYDDRRTISEPLNTSLADVSFHLILDSPPDKRSVNSMDFSGDTKQTDMDTDCSLLDSYDINPITTSPDFSVIKEEKFTKHRLESTPEEGEIKRFAADSSASNTSPSATLLCVGRRTSKGEVRLMNLPVIKNRQSTSSLHLQHYFDQIHSNFRNMTVREYSRMPVKSIDP